MASPLQVTVYRKSNCGLCDDADGMLERIGRRLPLQVAHVDIESDDTLRERYGMHIPVIEVDGREVARAPLSERTLEAALRGAGSLIPRPEQP